MDTLRECIVAGLNASSKFRIANSMCEGSLNVIVIRCNFPYPQYDYCKEERLVWYLKEHNMLNSMQHNSTVTPYSNLTGNSSYSNSTSP